MAWRISTPTFKSSRGESTRRSCPRVASAPPCGRSVAAYYVVAEAMTNSAKHASASYVTIRVVLTDDELRIDVTDDGVGGAMSTGSGSGLVGLRDRVEALPGRLDCSSPPGRGTSLTAAIPVVSDSPEPAAVG